MLSLKTNSIQMNCNSNVEQRLATKSFVVGQQWTGDYTHTTNTRKIWTLPSDNSSNLRSNQRQGFPQLHPVECFHKVHYIKVVRVKDTLWKTIDLMCRFESTRCYTRHTDFFQLNLDYKLCSSYNLCLDLQIALLDNLQSIPYCSNQGLQ